MRKHSYARTHAHTHSDSSVCATAARASCAIIACACSMLRRTTMRAWRRMTRLETGCGRMRCI